MKFQKLILLFFLVWISTFVSSKFVWAQSGDVKLAIGFTYPIDIENYKPEKIKLSHFREITGQLFMTLVQQNRNGEVLPGVAKKWWWHGDGYFLSFSLRKDLYWSNGTNLTAQDFVFSLKQNAHSGDVFSELENSVVGWSQWGEGKTDVRFGVEAIGKYELRFEFKQRRTVNILPFSMVFASKIHDSEPLLAEPKPWQEIDNPPSYRAYRVSAVLENQIQLEKNPFFPDADEIAVEKVNYYSGHSTNGLDAFANSKIDILIGPLGKQKRWVVSRYEAQIRPVSSPKLYYVLPDSRLKKMQNLDFLNALYSALDRESFGKKQFGSIYKHIESTIPKGFAGYKGAKFDKPKEAFSVGLAKARKYMESLGYSKENPLKLKLGVAITVPGYRDIAGFVQGSWGAIHVDLELVPLNAFADMLKRFND